MTETRQKTKVPTGVVALITASVVFSLAGAAAILLNSGLLKTDKTSKKTTDATVTITTTVIYDEAPPDNSTAITTTAACTPGSGPLPVNTATPGGIWLSISEVQALPMSGEAWNRVCNTAYATWGVDPYFPELRYHQSAHGTQVIAGALVYVRTGDPGLRTKVRDAILEAKRSADDDSELVYDPNGDPATTLTALPLGRRLTGYILAADLINLADPNFDPAADSEFRQWLPWILSAQVGPSGGNNCPSVIQCHEYIATNWSFFGGASRIAAAIYRGDTTEIDRVWKIFRAYTNRVEYPPDTWRRPSPPYPEDRDIQYFGRTSEWRDCRICTTDPTGSTWTAINPACVINGHNMDGAIIEDISRKSTNDPEEARCDWPPLFTGMMYTAGSLEGAFMQAEMLHRIGRDAYGYGSPALKRAMDFLVLRAGWTWYYASQRWLPWLANYRYHISYATPMPIGMSYSMGWTDWTHATPPTKSGGGRDLFETQ